MPAPLQSLLASLLGATADTTPQLSSHDRALMPTAQVEYQLELNAMAYFRFDRGFKAGGFNGSTGFGTPDQLSYGPEHVNAYELGLKTKWLNDTVLFNADVFRSDYKDLQVDAAVFVPAANGYTSEVKNAAASRSQGVEIETQWAVTRDFRLGANVTYLDSHYVSYPNAGLTLLQRYCTGLSAPAFSTTPQCAGIPYVPFQSLGGRPTEFAPRWSGSVTARYTVPLPQNLQLVSEISPYFTSKYFAGTGATDDPLGQQSSYVRLDARVALEAQNGRWGLDVIGKNLTDRVIISANETVYEIQAKEEPRNVAIQLRYRFD
jgi:outer membrane receptor protein involved in Fe transport